MSNNKDRAANVTDTAAKAVARITDPAKRAQAEAILKSMREKNAKLERPTTRQSTRRDLDYDR